MEKTSKPVLEPPSHHHHHHQTQSEENEAESKRQQKPERVLLVDKPYQSKKKVKPVVEKIKEPKRGLGVAKLEILRLEGKLKQVNEQLEQLQAEKEIIAAAAAPLPPPLLPKPHPQHQFQVPFPPFVDPMQQYPNGIIPVPYGRFVPVAGAMNKDGPHPHPHHVSFVFQPMNQNGGYPGEPMQVIPNGGGFPAVGFIPPAHHQPNNNMNGNGGFPAAHDHEPNNMINGNGGGSPGGHHHHHHHHEVPNNNMNGNGGGVPGGGVNINGGCPNQNTIAAGNPYMFLDQQLRVQHLKLMHSARELSAIQRMQYHMPPQHSAKFSVQSKPVININSEQLPKSEDKMVMKDSLDSLELSLGSRTNIHGKINTENDEEVEEVDAFGGRRSTSSVLMEYDFFPGESSESRSSSYAGGGGGGMGSSEASSSNENTTHMLDLSLKLSL